MSPKTKESPGRHIIVYQGFFVCGFFEDLNMQITTILHRHAWKRY